MKKTYVKPVASNVVFAMNENIAASFGSSHVGLTHNAVAQGESCNKHLANNTSVESGMIGSIENTSDLIAALVSIREQIGNDAFEAIIAEINATGTWSCWRT